MQPDIRQQYDQFSEEFSAHQYGENEVNRQAAYKMMPADLNDMSILDVGCGDGTDADYFTRTGATVTGIDASRKLIDLAKIRYPDIRFEFGFAENLPYEDNQFDCVYSKYAILTSPDIGPILSEFHRVLKPHGILVYLVTHPLRQFLEKKKTNADYFKKETVTSVIFGGAVTLQEPTHTFMEYFDKDFFARFEMIDYNEAFDPTAEQINGAVYPGFMVVKARKK